MKTHPESARDIPVVFSGDVVVAGGGPAGLAAAIASARTGARTLLLERFGFLGGVATAGLMANLNGFRNQVEPDATQTVRGIAEELVLKLKDMDGLGTSPYPQKEYPTRPGEMSYSYAIDTEKFKYLALKTCVDAGADVLLHSFFCDSIMEAGTIRGIIIENKSGRQALLAKVVIDATGDGDVAARSGAPFWHTKESSEPALGNSLMYRIGLSGRKPEDMHAVDLGSDLIVWGPEAGRIDGTDGFELSGAEIAARLAVFDHFRELKARHPGLAGTRIAETPVMYGIRQTRFIEGEYKLTGEDAIIGRRFPDVVALSSCPIIGFYGYRRYLEHEGYDIPYRCLVPKKVENLLVAGRCISSDQRAYESHRAMLPIMAVGQAAGTAAALAARHNAPPRRLRVGELQKALRTQGAVLDIPGGS